MSSVPSPGVEAGGASRRWPTQPQGPVRAGRHFRLDYPGAVTDATEPPSSTTGYAILGPLEVVRAGDRVEPTSPKQRALLIDLLVHHNKTLNRDRLVEDLWGDSPPATAAGVLQSYVSQLRKLLGPEAIRTSGPGYAIAIDGAQLDSVRFERLIDDARATRAVGEMHSVAHCTGTALALWRGEPLADVAFEAFALAETGRLRELRAEAIELRLEAEIAVGQHRRSLGGLEAALIEYPLRERLWWLLMLALYRSGRQTDALSAYQKARTVLRDDLGLEPGPELRDLETAILQQQPALDRLLVPTARPRSPRPGVRTPLRPPAGPLVGRAAERQTLVGFLDAARAEGAGRLLMLIGEPGIGKTRLLEEAQAHVEAAGGQAAVGRSFEAERGRPYGAWADALRSMALPVLAESLCADLAPLLPELSSDRVDLDDPSRLYDAVVALLTHLSEAHPTVVLLDDLHWLDEPSTALLHFSVRHLSAAGVAFVATVRTGEMADNLACRRVVDALRSDDLLVEVPVGPLPAETIGELTRPIAPAADPDRIAEVSNGNPLFALEMARALARGDDPLSSRLDALIGDRLGRLGEQAAALVPWIAAFGRSIDVSVLAQAVDRDGPELFDPLGELEHRGVLQETDEGTYGFTHDLVRAAAYKRISTPRRTMLHARIGRVLNRTPDPDDTLAAETARHAEAGHDRATCAAACVRAARRCLRLLAYRDAEALVELGRDQARRLQPEVRIPLEIQLIHVLLHPGLRLRQPGDLAGELTELCADSQRLGLTSDLHAGLVLLSRVYYWSWGDIPRATALMQRAVKILDAASEPDVEPLLESARCLAYMEMDMERTSQLFDQLGALEDLAGASHQYHWGLGLVRAWAGRLSDARAALRRAIELATARHDHWATFECTARLAVLELETGQLDAASLLSGRLPALAATLGEGGSERTYARAIVALAALTRGETGSRGEFDHAIEGLERLDAFFLTPDLLGIAAEAEYRAGDLAAATEHAGKALDTAETAGRPLEAARARALLACMAARRAAVDEAMTHLQAGPADDGNLPRHVVALRREARRLVDDPTAEQSTAEQPKEQRWP